MKKMFLLSALALPLLAGNAMAQSKKGFTINGELANVETGKSVFLVNNNLETNKTDTLAKAVTTNGKFTLTGAVKSPELWYLTIQNQRGGVPLFIENTAMTLNGSAGSLRDVKVTGSKTQEELYAYNDKVKVIAEKSKPLEEEYKAAKAAGDKAKMDQIVAKYESLKAEELKISQEYAKNNPQSLVSPFVLVQSLDDENVASYASIYEKFSATVKQSNSAKSLKKNIDLINKTAVGQVAPMFAGKTPEGKDLALKEVLSSGKYTLVDFWASWCGPCRAENPNVVGLYEKYHAKGFNILGVSLDKDAEKWKKAIADDKLIWNHVSDLKFWQSEFAAMYGVKSIPATFLLDANGKIVGKNLRGEQLAKKLEELLSVQ